VFWRHNFPELAELAILMAATKSHIFSVDISPKM